MDGAPNPEFRLAPGTPLAEGRSIGVAAVNGPDYARVMLDLLADGQVAVPLRAPDDAERIGRAGVGRILVPRPGGGWVEGSFVSTPGPAPALVSFSSGTEGAPKAVVLSKDALHDVVTRLTEAMELTPEIREYVGVPVHHSFGFGRVRAVLNAGGACLVPQAGFALTELRDRLRAGDVNAVSAVPSQWRVFLANLDVFGPELERVRWVEIGSQPMTADEKRALRRALPAARILQHYGLTEASRTTLLRIDQAPEAALASVGRAEGATGLRIADDGVIEIRGPHVALGVAQSGGWRPLGPERWLRTSDLGRLEDGWLFHEGRADDVINCGGVKLSPDAVEAHVRAAVPEAGEDFGVLRTPDLLRGDSITVALAPGAAAHGAAIEAAVRAYARGQGLELGGAVRLATVAALPRTETGKLQRRVLAAELEAQDAETAPTAELHEPYPVVEATLSRAGAIFLERLAELLGSEAQPSRRYVDLGGDSLNHLQVTLLLDQALGAAPEAWEEMRFQDLAARIPDGETGTDVGLDLALAALQPPSTPAPPLPKGERNQNPPGIGFWRLVREDFRCNGSDLSHQGFWMLFIHRFGNWRMDVRPKLLRMPLSVFYKVLNKLGQMLFGIKLDYTVKVGRRVRLEHFGGMILGGRSIGDDVVLRQNTTLGIRTSADLNAKPMLGNRIDVGAGAVIVGHVTIGDDVVIGANAVVTRDVPAGHIAAGVPARIRPRRPVRRG